MGKILFEGTDVVGKLDVDGEIVENVDFCHYHDG